MAKQRAAQGPDTTPAGSDTIEATFVKRRVFNEGWSWAISEVEDPKHTIKGPMLDPRPGCRVRLLGCKTVSHPTYGPQITYRAYEWLGFADRRGITRYLADTCQGIGKRLAERIVEEFGDAAIDTLRDHPEQVSVRVPSVSPECAAEAAAHLREHADESRLHVLLRGAGIGPRVIKRVIEFYHVDPAELLALLQKNPWKLADDVDQVGFKTADRFALAMGHPPDSPLRARSALRHFALEAARQKGHVLVTAAAIADEATECGIPQGRLDAAITEPVSQTGVARVMVGDTPYLCPMKLYAAEQGVARRVSDMASAPAIEAKWSEDALTEYLKRAGSVDKATGVRSPIALDQTQVDAIAAVRTRRISVVTGGPGTGKSAILQAAYAGLAKFGSVRVLAPTGKAAVRIRRDSGIQASTIHRALLQSKGVPLAADVICVDEASMIDIEVMAWLLSSLKDDCAIHFFGDVDQLPPVGPGCPFRDMIASGKVPVFRLAHVWRTDKQWLKENARLVNAGQMPRWGGGVEDFFVMERANDGIATAAAETIVDVVAKRLPARYSIDQIDDVQVIVPMKPEGRGLASAEPMNRALRDAINPATSAPGLGGFRKGDKVMQVRNDYELGVMNGEIGRVEQLGKKGEDVPPPIAGRLPCEQKSHTTTCDGTCEGHYVAREDWLLVDFGYEDSLPYTMDNVGSLVLAYAITIHKAQGSGWKFVVIPVVKQHQYMLTRKLLYTAMTRAIEAAILVADSPEPGKPHILQTSIRKTTDDRRETLVRRWLENGCEGFEPTNPAPQPEPETVADGTNATIPDAVDAARPE